MLSKRGREQVPGNAFNEMWEVMKNPWDRHSNPTGAVNLGVAENHLMEAELRDYVTKHVALRSSVVTYQDGPLGSHRLREALARFLSRHLATHRPLDAAHIMVTNGVSSALEHVAWALADPGEAFLVGRPYYGEITLRLRPHVRTVPASFGDVDPLSLPAVRCYEEALLRAREQGQVVRGLLLCSPHNPLGRCYPREVLVALAALCNKYQLHLVSDEVYALSVWRDAPTFTSVLALDLDSLIDPALVHVLWGVSKDFGANGWRVGCLVSPRNPALRAALSSIAIYSYASSLADAVVTQVLQDDAFTSAYLAENRRRLAAAYAFTTDFLQRHGIPFAAGTHAALFVWADLGWAYRRCHPRSEREQATTIADDVRDALRRHKVYLASGDNFDSESPDMFRIVFAHPRDRLEEGLRRMHQALLQGGIGVPAGDQPCAPVDIGMPLALAQTPAVGRQALAAPASQGRSLLS